MIYEKKGQDNKVHLYKTAANTDVPAADDVQLSYKDDGGNEITPSEYKLFYDTTDSTNPFQSMKASKQTYATSEDAVVNVWAGDELVIGGEAIKVTYSGSLITNADIFISGTKVTSDDKVVDVIKGAKAVIKVVPAEGYEVTAATISVGSTALTVVVADGVATAETAVLEEAVTVTVSATVAEAQAPAQAAPKSTRKKTVKE